ncbi:MAG: hypothetical protein ACRELG_23685 [Gemmataceae bacterium]
MSEFPFVFRPKVRHPAMSVPQKVLELVDLFRRNADAYHAPQYNEAMVRQEFINPFFKRIRRLLGGCHGGAGAQDRF